jgi:hypothetical protein
VCGCSQYSVIVLGTRCVGEISYLVAVLLWHEVRGYFVIGFSVDDYFAVSTR